MSGPHVADRARETTLTGGSGTVNLEGAVAGFRSLLSKVGDGNSCYYMITDGTDWETGRGTVVAGTPDTLVRNSGANVTYESSNADAAVVFATGTKEVLISNPAFREQDRYAKVALTAGVSIPSGPFAVLTWDAAGENPYGLHDLGTNPERLTADIAGLYEVFVGGPWAASGLGDLREIDLLKDGATSVGGDAKPPTGSLSTRHAISVPVRFAAGEYVEARVRQNTAGALLFGSAGVDTYFGMRRLGI